MTCYDAKEMANRKIKRLTHACVIFRATAVDGNLVNRSGDLARWASSPSRAVQEGRRESPMGAAEQKWGARMRHGWTVDRRTAARCGPRAVFL